MHENDGSAVPPRTHLSLSVCLLLRIGVCCAHLNDILFSDRMRAGIENVNGSCSSSSSPVDSVKLMFKFKYVFSCKRPE